MTPDKHVVAGMMTRTYPLRHKQILEEDSTLPQILKNYPPLKNSEDSFITWYMNIHKY